MTPRVQAIIDEVRKLTPAERLELGVEIWALLDDAESDPAVPADLTEDDFAISDDDSVSSSGPLDSQ